MLRASSLIGLFFKYMDLISSDRYLASINLKTFLSESELQYDSQSEVIASWLIGNTVLYLSYKHTSLQKLGNSHPTYRVSLRFHHLRL